MVYLLEKEQRELEASLSLIVYPVLTLPIEITARIFVDCLPYHGHITPSSRTAPLLLAQICHDWRNIALSTCRLWSSFDTSTLHRYSPKPGLKHLLAAWFPRAKGCLLSLTVRAQQNAQPEVPLKPFLSSIPSFSTQIQRLELNISSTQFRLLRPLPFFPNLEYLAVKVGGNDVKDLIHRSPSIRKLHLQRFDLPSNLAIQWLTCLDIDLAISVETFMSILRHFPLLSHLGCPVKESHSKSLLPKAFPRLESLTLDSIGLDPLDCLILPNLRRLDVSPSARDLGILTSLISRSACVLEDVDFCIDGRDDEQALLWLQAFPSVTTLNIDIDTPAGFLTFIETPPPVIHISRGFFSREDIPLTL
ncbi:hypothetical protein C8R43DRAFT_1129210 [Mycena crocata]|nr:hypothetical protein C8R43DRAFT_1129210 [Mycena crocata]